MTENAHTPGLAASLEGREYTPGDTYTISTFADLFALYIWLPDDRAALMLDELASGIRLSAAHLKLVSTIIGFVGATSVIGTEGLSWIDDDKGTGEINVKVGERAEDTISLRYERATGAPSHD